MRILTFLKQGLAKRLVSARRRAFSFVCVVCRQRCQGVDLCAACFIELTAGLSRCGCCGLRGESSTGCFDCGRSQFEFDTTTVAFDYEGLGAALLRRFKFRHQRALGRIFSTLLLEKIALQADKPELIVAVPMHPLRRVLRGFSPADDIAQDLASRLSIPYVQVFNAKFEWRSQRHLSRKERRCNVSGKYALIQNVDISARRVALVDDVMTTGATLSHLAGLLKAENVQYVECYVVARTPLGE